MSIRHQAFRKRFRKIFKKRTSFGVLFFFRVAVGLAALFFCLPNRASASDQSQSGFLAANLIKARDLRWADDPVWQSLPHLSYGLPQIDDTAFYIHRHFSSATAELEDSLTAMFKPSAALEPESSFQCRFPARFQWLSEKVGAPPPTFSECTDLAEFRRRAPLTSAALVFAAEKVSHPSTMMGHVFLKISGANHKGQPVDHAISFFTDLNDGNFPKLVFESLLTGKTGFYALSPFEEVKNGYLFSEERNIWEYEFLLNDSQRQRLHLHLFELKTVSFRYFFIGFNCATLIQNVIAVAHPKVNETRGFWVTPLDVVRSSDKPEFIFSTKVAPASRWKVKVLNESLGPSWAAISRLQEFQDESVPADRAVSVFDNEIERDGPDGSSRYLHLELAEAYAGNLLENRKISESRWRALSLDLMNRRKSLVSDGFIDLSSFKRPSLTRRDSQVSLASFYDRVEKSVRLRFLPASHALEDETLQYTSESELKIGELEAEYLANESRFRVSKAVLYSAVSLQPSDRLISALSGRFRMGYEVFREIDLSRTPSPFIDTALGKTIRLTGDVDLYALASVGTRVPMQAYAYAGPEVGVVVREIWRMKTIVSWRKIFFGFGAQDEALRNADAWSRSLSELTLSQTLNFKDFALIAALSLHDNTRASRPSAEVTLRRYF